MKNELKTAKIQQFLNDEAMSEAVKEELLYSFLSGNSKDVQYLAASRIAIDLLKESWKDLQKYKQSQENVKTSDQIGL